ncbi:hypothetical protein GR11A_00037 [Vibrio phage vB_VcorM_GR11A]|nr:hypothetical protein GR11A_00037 [Vibrio phage vB_VcorM_GR11A]
MSSRKSHYQKKQNKMGNHNKKKLGFLRQQRQRKLNQPNRILTQTELEDAQYA